MVTTAMAVEPLLCRDPRTRARAGRAQLSQAAGATCPDARRVRTPREEETEGRRPRWTGTGPSRSRACEVNPHTRVAPASLCETAPVPPIADPLPRRPAGEPTGQEPSPARDGVSPSTGRPGTAAPRPAAQHPGAMTSTLLRLLAAALVAGLLPAAAAPPTVRARLGVWPLQPRPEVVRGFDPPTSRWGAGHRGVDLLGRLGQPVHAAEAGTRHLRRPAGRPRRGGRRPRSARTTYEPVDAAVHVGDPVAGGQVWAGSRSPARTACRPPACTGG